MSHECCAPQTPSQTPHALHLARVFWPDTVIYEDRVYFDIPDADYFAELMDFAENDPITVQALLNHQHLLDLAGDATLDRPALIEFGQRLQACWQTCFAAQYPDRPIVVAFDPQDEDADDELQIVFYEETAE
ncbi:MAG: hypothetical protein RLY58_1331 [Pseudomonadota bacterium]|jgi:hypothetical protein